MSQNGKRKDEEGDSVREIARVSLLASGLSVAACVMGLSIGAAYGASTAGSGAAAAAPAPAVLKAEDLSGRWTGNYHGLGELRSRCQGGACKITLDIAPCGESWCGVLVKDDGACGGVAMKTELGEFNETRMQFNGTLELDPKAAGYVIQVTLWSDNEGKRRVEIIGDTGKELMFMRRSFPFSARLARSGDTVCTAPKATS